MGQGGAVKLQSLLPQGHKDTKAMFRNGCLGVLVVSFLIILVALPVLASSPAQEQVSVNLLADADFEAPPPWPQQDGIGEVQVAPGWRAYYLDAPPKYVEVPSNCSDHPHDAPCFWMRPEFRDNTSFASRIHSGQRSQKYFSYGRMHEAGLWQQVRGIPIGARVRFSIWTQAWMCADPDQCGEGGAHSDNPSDMHLRVGIDPLGGTDPFTPTVVWSAERPAWDKWVQFQVETIAISDTVTVFTHSRADWEWARINNDVYLDDANLVIVGAYASSASEMATWLAAITHTLATQSQPSASLPATPTRVLAVSATPTSTASTLTPTSFPPGAVTHTVSMGDTLFDIALRHDVQVTDLLELNGITTSTELYLGEPLIVEMATLTPTPTPEPIEPTETPMPTSTLLPSATPTLAPAAVATLPPAPDHSRQLALAILIGGSVLIVAATGFVVVRLVRPSRRDPPNAS
jgi:LysM repeat protein